MAGRRLVLVPIPAFRPFDVKRLRRTLSLRPYRAQISRAPRPLAQGIQIVRPRLHHLATLRQPLRFVVSRANLVALRVRQLQLDDIRRETLLIEEGARHTAKSMTRLLVARVTEPPQRRIDGVIRHRTIERKERRKYVGTTPGERLELAKNCDRL